MKMLAKGLDERFQTADQVVEAIEDASMRAGTILSGSAVARLMRDLFGTRPEPWLTLGLTAPADATSVLTEPLPMPASGAAALESELANVPDMTGSTDVETAEIADAKPATVTPVAQRKMPTIVISTPIAAAPGLAGMLFAAPGARPDKAQVNSTLLGVGHRAPSSSGAGVAYSPPMRIGSQPMPPGLVSDASGSMAVPTNLATSSDMIPLPGALARPSSPEIEPRSTGPLIAIGAAVVVVAIVLIAIVASRGGAPAREPAVVHMEPAPAPPTPPPPVVIPPPPPPSPAIARLRAAYDAQDFATAFAACKDVAKTTDADVAAMCVMAACNRRDSVIARRWLASVHGDHAKLIADCKQAGKFKIGP
jgi:hypothetical protein